MPHEHLNGAYVLEKTIPQLLYSAARKAAISHGTQLLGGLFECEAGVPSSPLASAKD
jgi:hypothetical protein